MYYTINHHNYLMNYTNKVRTIQLINLIYYVWLCVCIISIDSVCVCAAIEITIGTWFLQSEVQYIMAVCM